MGLLLKTTHCYPLLKRWILTDCMFLSCHVHFQSESTLYSCLNVKKLLAQSRHKIWSLSDCNWAQTHKPLSLQTNTQPFSQISLFLNDWAMLRVLTCTVHLTVCCYHVTYTFQSESTPYSCLNVKELLAWSRHKIWGLGDCNWTWTHNHLVHK